MATIAGAPIKVFTKREFKDHEITRMVDSLAEAVYTYLLAAASYKRITSLHIYEGAKEGSGQLFFCDLDVATSAETRPPDYDRHLHMRVIWQNDVPPLQVEIGVAHDDPTLSKRFLLESRASEYVLMAQ